MKDGTSFPLKTRVQPASEPQKRLLRTLADILPGGNRHATDHSSQRQKVVDLVTSRCQTSETLDLHVLGHKTAKASRSLNPRQERRINLDGYQQRSFVVHIPGGEKSKQDRRCDTIPNEITDALRRWTAFGPCCHLLELTIYLLHVITFDTRSQLASTQPTTS